jgi:uncharacterized protein
MSIEFDPGKRELTLQHRGLDMADAGEIFAGNTITIKDDRKDYGEKRYFTIGSLKGRMVVMVWTPRGAARRIISLRKANEREQKTYSSRLA